MKWQRFVFAAIMLYLLSFSLGCSYFARFYQPLSPREQMIADIWPILNASQKREISRLTSEEEASAYIERFWKERDPTPGTPVNEYRVEYEARLVYVHDHFPYKRGWTHSDQARVYLIYGPPDDIYYGHWVLESNLKGSDLNDVEIWVYNLFVADTHPPTPFDLYDPHLLKFAFADLTGSGRYTQIYSNMPGEIIDSRVYAISSSGFIF